MPRPHGFSALPPSLLVLGGTLALLAAGVVSVRCIDARWKRDGAVLRQAGSPANPRSSTQASQADRGYPRSMLEPRRLPPTAEALPVAMFEFAPPQPSSGAQPPMRVVPGPGAVEPGENSAWGDAGWGGSTPGTGTVPLEAMTKRLPEVDVTPAGAAQTERLPLDWAALNDGTLGTVFGDSVLRRLPPVEEPANRSGDIQAGEASSDSPAEAGGPGEEQVGAAAAEISAVDLRRLPPIEDARGADAHTESAPDFPAEPQISAGPPASTEAASSARSWISVGPPLPIPTQGEEPPADALLVDEPVRASAPVSSPASEMEVAADDALVLDAPRSPAAAQPAGQPAIRPARPHQPTAVRAQPVRPSMAHDDPRGRRDNDPRMAAVSQQAMEMVQYGFSLGERGALYSARTQFVQALRLIAQTLDAMQESTLHGESLAHGLRALEECDDFVPRGSQLEAEMDLVSIIAAHRTPILKDDKSPVPLHASQRYLQYAQSKLADAAGHVPAGSMALYALGKLYLAEPGQTPQQRRLNDPKAVALQQAALAVDERNYVAANELGVLLARYGQLEDARSVLLHGLSLHATASLWHNLAVVHERLGEMDLAQRARYEQKQASKQSPKEELAAAIHWMPPDDFARASQNGDSPPEVPVNLQSAQKAASAATTGGLGRAMQWLGWTTNR